MDFVRFALRYAYSRRNAAAYVALCWVVWIIVFYVNALSVGLLSYLVLFSLAPVLFFEIRRMLRLYQKHLTMGDMTEISVKTLDEFAAEYPPEESFADEDYQSLLRRCAEAAEDDAEPAPDGVAFAEYYTRWAKEIKEPVNAMRQLLLSGDSPMVRRMSVEAARMERYAEMAAAYARLEAGPEYALRKYDVSAIVEKCLKKFGGESLEKKIPVNFEPAPIMIVTDGKWLSFVLEQILSNAFRYAFSGEITVTASKEADAPEDTDGWETATAGPSPGTGPFLTVRDGGVGISPDAMEHLLDADAPSESGLGLYLCRRICDGLGHSMTVMSKEGEGTLVRLELSMGLASPEETDNPQSAESVETEPTEATNEDE